MNPSMEAWRRHPCRRQSRLPTITAPRHIAVRLQSKANAMLALPVFEVALSTLAIALPAALGGGGEQAMDGLRPDLKAGMPS